MTQELSMAGETMTDSVELSRASQAKGKGLCANCGEVLGGQFCHSCGQSSKSMIKFFGEVVKELLDDALGYDSRLKHSLFPLFFKPGRLTLDYVKGKRFHYVLPFKLYLITSVLFILLIKNTADTEQINFNNGGEQNAETIDEIKKDVSANINDALGKIEDEELKQELAHLSVELSEAKTPLKDIVTTKKIATRTELTSQANEVNVHLPIINHDQATENNELKDADDKDHSINLHWNDSTGQFDGVDDIDNTFLKTFLIQINPKLKHWKEDLSPFVESVIEALPFMMFIILPIFALFLKLFYAFSKRFYTEHLVFLLHNHSFIYMLLMVQIGLGFGEEKLLTIDHWAAQTASGIFSFISVILGFWMFTYVFLAVKRFYRQGWFATIFKSISLGFIYFIMLVIGFASTVVITAYQA